MRIIPATFAVLAMAVTLAAAPANKANDSVEQQLRAQYVLTEASHFNRVSSTGTVVVIQLAGLNAAPPASLSGATAWYINTIKDGARQNRGFREYAWQTQGTLRPIQPGEKFYVTKLDFKDNAITFYLVSCEQIDAKHYYAGVTFQFAKGYQTTVPVANIQQAVAQVLTIEGQAQKAQQGGQPGPEASGQSSLPPPVATTDKFAPIPPPPPPTDAPTTTIDIKPGQTPDQVKGALGQPERIIRAGSKEIYFFKDLKITFIDGKVSEVE